MTVSDWIVIVAIIIGPVLAVQVQKYIEKKNETRDRKIQIFKTLMAMRGEPLSRSYVEALNMIDIEFYKDQKITNAWKLLLDNFYDYPQDVEEPNYQAKLDARVEKSKDLLADLLFEMSRLLGYDFDKVHIKRGAYIPRGHAEIEIEQTVIRKKFIEFLNREIPIPINIVK